MSFKVDIDPETLLSFRIDKACNGYILVCNKYDVEDKMWINYKTFVFNDFKCVIDAIKEEERDHLNFVSNV